MSRKCLCIVLALALTSAASPHVISGEHTWDVNELFSNADGTIWFIELRETNGGNLETGVSGNQVTSNTNSFTIPTNVASPTGFKHLLFANQAFANLPGAPTPDHIIMMNNFFSVNGDTIRYTPWDTVTFGSGVLPTDGVRSLNRNLTTGTNSPTNYAGQTGSVDASPQPPGVPDGSAGTEPMSVTALDASGTSLSISWDTTSCTGAGQHHLIYGQGTQLPSIPGGAFSLTGSACALGTTSPFIWDPAPSATDGTGLIWWLIVATNGSTVEGSWGRSSDGLERNGTGANGSSGQCGVTNKSVTNTCGH